VIRRWANLYDFYVGVVSEFMRRSDSEDDIVLERFGTVKRLGLCFGIRSRNRHEVANTGLLNK
jgi:hypothetical protein